MNSAVAPLALLPIRHIPPTPPHPLFRQFRVVPPTVLRATHRTEKAIATGAVHLRQTPDATPWYPRGCPKGALL